MDLQSYIELKKKYASMQSPQPISEEVEELDEKFKISDLFTGDSEARRQLRAAKAGQGGTSGQGGSDTGYDPKTGTSRTASGRNVVVAPKGGKAGTMEPGKPDSWRPLPAGDTASQQAMRRYGQVKAGNEAENQRNRQERRSTGTGQGNRSYRRNTGSGSSTSAPAGAPGGARFSSPADEKRQAARAAGQDPDKIGGGSSGGGSSRPAGGSGGGGSRPAGGARPSSSTRPAPAAAPKPTPQKQTGDKAKDMATWAKANPKLAAAQKQRAATRGTTASSNPLMKGMGRAPKPTPTAAPKPTTTPKATPFKPSGSGSGPKFNPNAPKIKLNNSVEVDSFDIILEYLVGSGFPEQEALVIMSEMSEEKREQILEEMKHREADTGKVVDKAEVGKTYYPHGERKKSSVAIRKEKEAAEKKTQKEEIDSLRDAYNSVFAPKEEISEEEADKLRDKRQERGGVDGNKRYPGFASATELKKHGVPGAKTAAQREAEEKYGKGATAMDIVKAQMEKKYGKGAIMDPKKKKKD